MVTLLSVCVSSAAVFGCDLGEQFCPDQQRAPWVIVKCTEELEKRARDQGMCTQSATKIADRKCFPVGFCSDIYIIGLVTLGVFRSL